jgi:hypothetical protein
MTDNELINTLRIAAESQDSIALRMLLLMAAERIESVSSQRD